MHIWTILLASGQGTRISGQKTKKQFLPWKNRPLYWHSAQTFAAVPRIKGLTVTLPPDEAETRQAELASFWKRDALGLEYTACVGGASRQESVRKALSQLPPECSHVLIHDAARPFIRPHLIQQVIDSLASGAVAAIPSLPVTDTIKERVEGHRLQTLDRNRLFAVQTPQGFARNIICQAHSLAVADGWHGTDDAALVERMDHPVQLIPGQKDNIKITTDQDLTMLHEPNTPAVHNCIGWGYDVHRFGPGRPMKLGGIAIANGPEIEAHSDGDVLLHSLIDALLGCLGQGDIGDFFPDTDPRYEKANSGLLLAEILDLAGRQGLKIDHVDMTIICQVPKISPWKGQIKKNVSSLLGLTPDQVNIKATTEEHLGFTGSKQGIKAVVQIIGHRTLPVETSQVHGPNMTTIQPRIGYEDL
jgi:2-C-methyl-D-erythritol 4-phosphate cytidylyltransferase/2-C-methyl-D-erythritol 2,4-cyclodiphosphate synthase